MESVVAAMAGIERKRQENRTTAANRKGRVANIGDPFGKPVTQNPATLLGQHREEVELLSELDRALLSPPRRLRDAAAMCNRNLRYVPKEGAS